MIAENTNGKVTLVVEGYRRRVRQEENAQQIKLPPSKKYGKRIKTRPTSKDKRRIKPTAKTCQCRLRTGHNNLE